MIRDMIQEAADVVHRRDSRPMLNVVDAPQRQSLCSPRGNTRYKLFEDDPVLQVTHPSRGGDTIFVALEDVVELRECLAAARDASWSPPRSLESVDVASRSRDTISAGERTCVVCERRNTEHETVSQLYLEQRTAMEGRRLHINAACLGAFVAALDDVDAWSEHADSMLGDAL